jgi:hypothetical protein
MTLGELSLVVDLDSPDHSKDNYRTAILDRILLGAKSPVANEVKLCRSPTSKR